MKGRERGERKEEGGGMVKEGKEGEGERKGERREREGGREGQRDEYYSNTQVMRPLHNTA